MISTKTQMDLSRERQSRDDVLLLGEHKFQTLKDEYEHLNESKITIEKELYAQQDTLRRTVCRSGERREGARRRAGRDPKAEGRRKLRQKSARRDAEESGERVALKLARERENSPRKDLDAAHDRLEWFENECAKLNHQVEELNKLMLSSGEFGLKNDQAKERLERELHTVKSRLAASENDNRALLNKLQQKGLRDRTVQLEGERGVAWPRSRACSGKRRGAEEQNAKLHKQLGESQLTCCRPREESLKSYS